MFRALGGDAWGHGVDAQGHEGDAQSTGGMLGALGGLLRAMGGMLRALEGCSEPQGDARGHGRLTAPRAASPGTCSTHRAVGPWITRGSIP